LLERDVVELSKFASLRSLLCLTVMFDAPSDGAWAFVHNDLNSSLSGSAIENDA
jgi:hypothetical protein